MYEEKESGVLKMLYLIMWVLFYFAAGVIQLLFLEVFVYDEENPETDFFDIASVVAWPLLTLLIVLCFLVGWSKEIGKILKEAFGGEKNETR